MTTSMIYRWTDTASRSKAGATVAYDEAQRHHRDHKKKLDEGSAALASVEAQHARAVQQQDAALAKRDEAFARYQEAKAEVTAAVRKGQCMTAALENKLVAAEKAMTVAKEMVAVHAEVVADTARAVDSCRKDHAHLVAAELEARLAVKTIAPLVEAWSKREAFQAVMASIDAAVTEYDTTLDQLLAVRTNYRAPRSVDLTAILRRTDDGHAADEKIEEPTIKVVVIANHRDRLRGEQYVDGLIPAGTRLTVTATELAEKANVLQLEADYDRAQAEAQALAAPKPTIGDALFEQEKAQLRADRETSIAMQRAWARATEVA
ncbi:MAG: hypothetical protein JWM53_6426 [bacterium]|nr:hypothetical protein [bacterium]